MLEKSMYDSWASRIRLFIKGKKNAQQLQDECDVQATNIILHTLPPDMYALVNHQEASKDIWDRVKLLMKGTELSYQERECRLMTMQQVQVNTKFLNALPPEWSKFVTDVKLAKSLYTTNYDQLYAYLSQHERHGNEVHIMYEIYPDPLALQGEDPIDCINKAMTFLSSVASSSRGNYAAGHAKAVKCYNCLGEGHMVKQCAQPKRPRSSAWFKEKLMLAEAQEIIPKNSAFQTEDLDAYDSNCDDISSAKAVLMANLSSCDLDVLSEVPYSDTQMDDLIWNRNAKFANFQQEIDTLKETLSNPVKEKESSSTTLTVFKTECKEKESKYMDKEIVLENQTKELENTLCKLYRSM
ncbi:reverse transcriptase domain-containing protein [Tanacetum coccineum]